MVRNRRVPRCHQLVSPWRSTWVEGLSLIAGCPWGKWDPGRLFLPHARSDSIIALQPGRQKREAELRQHQYQFLARFRGSYNSLWLAAHRGIQPAMDEKGGRKHKKQVLRPLPSGQGPQDDKFGGSVCFNSRAAMPTRGWMKRFVFQTQQVSVGSRQAEPKITLRAALRDAREHGMHSQGSATLRPGLFSTA